MPERPEVSLRPFESADAPAVHRWFNNAAATASLMEQRAAFSLEEAEAWVGRAMDDSGEDRKYAIVVEGHEEPVGFTAPPRPRRSQRAANRRVPARRCPRRRARNR